MKVTLIKHQDDVYPRRDGRCDNDLGLDRPTRGVTASYSVPFHGTFEFCAPCVADLRAPLPR